MTMRIELIKDLPVHVRACKKGSQWEVEVLVEGTRKQGCPAYWFEASSGVRIIAYADEAKVIEKRPVPRRRKYGEAYYG